MTLRMNWNRQVLLHAFVAIGAYAQGAPNNDSLHLSILRAVDTPTSITLSLKNTSGKPIVIPVRHILDTYSIEIRDVDGMEPPESESGVGMRRSMRVFGGGPTENRKLEPGGKLEHSIDLGLFWTLKAGQYSVVAKRTFRLDGRSIDVLAKGDLYVTQNSECTPIRARGRFLEIERSKLSVQPPASLQKSLGLRFRDTRTPVARKPLDTFSRLLKASNLPGGISVWGRDSEAGMICAGNDRTNLEVLEDLHTANSHLRLDWRSPVINMVDDRTTRFLDTAIGSREIPSPALDPLGAVAALLTAPEIETAMRELSLQSLGGPPVSQSPSTAEKLLLRNLTLREALNTIAERHGSGFWFYWEIPLPDSTGHVFQLNLSFGALR